MTNKTLLWLGGALLLLSACEQADAVVGGVRGGPTAASGGASGAGGTGGPTQAPCPANNLTQACTCTGGKPGRQICSEATGWGACDCGQAMNDTGMDDLLSGSATPPQNLDTSLTFEDYVVPQMLNDGDCKPGNYVGTFECGYTPGGQDGGAPFEVSGVVSFALSQSANSEVLVIEDGLLDGWGVMFFFAYLTGELSCATGEISGTADDGFYNAFLKGCAGAMGDVPGQNCIITDKNDPGYMPWTVNLGGFYAGSLDPSTDTITGTWSLSPLDLGGSCDGTFTVTLMP